MRERSIGDLFNNFSDFARRQPLTVMAGSVFAGFLVSRFLKSNAANAPTVHADRRSGRSFDQLARRLAAAARRALCRRARAANGRGASRRRLAVRLAGPGGLGGLVGGSTGTGRERKRLRPSTMTTDGTSGERDGR